MIESEKDIEHEAPEAIESEVAEQREAQDAEFAGRVLRDVRYIQREAGSEEERDEAEEEPQRQRRTLQDHSILWLLVTGNVLLLRSLTKYYGQLVIVAAVFLLSIIVMFWSLHLDMQYNALVRDVQLLRERSIRLEEVRYSRCSHSSIVEELERRGIDLKDPTTPATVIERKHRGW